MANTLYSIAYFSNEALKQCGYPAIPDEKYRRIVGDGVDMQIRRMLTAVTGRPPAERESAKLKEVYCRLYGNRPAYLVREYPGMRRALAALKEKGVATAVLTNKPDAWAREIIDFLFPKGSFELRFGQRPGIPRKPSPAGALMIAEKFGLEPKEILYLGDTNTDMKTGNGAGMDTAGVLWGFRDRRELEENGAVYILKTPDDILSVANTKR